MWLDGVMTNLLDNPVTEDQSSVLSIVSEKLHLEAMEHPFEYIKQLQADLITARLNLQKTMKTLSHQSQSSPNGRCILTVTSGGLWAAKSRKEISTMCNFLES